jgi:hypothetical protein
MAQIEVRVKSLSSSDVRALFNYAIESKDFEMMGVDKDLMEFCVLNFLTNPDYCVRVIDNRTRTREVYKVTYDSMLKAVECMANHYGCNGNPSLSQDTLIEGFDRISENEKECKLDCIWQFILHERIVFLS